MPMWVEHGEALVTMPTKERLNPKTMSNTERLDPKTMPNIEKIGPFQQCT